MPGQLIAVPYELRETFQRGLTQYKIIFLSAGPGWGKTTVVKKLLEKQNPVYLSLRKKPLPHYFSKERIIVMDDFHALPPQSAWRLRELLYKARRGQCFILLSRGPLPEYLFLYEAAGTLLRLNSGALALDMECLTQLVCAGHLSLTPGGVRRLRSETGGCPAAVRLLLRALSDGQPFQQPAIDAMREKMGVYLDEAALRPLDPRARSLLTELSLFDPFDQALAEALAGHQAVLPLLEAMRGGGLLERTGEDWRMADQSFLRPYLRKKLLTEYPPARIRSVHLAGGRWYAGKRDDHNALYHYRQADCRALMLDTLTQNARQHPGAGACYALRDDYDLLTEQEIRANPDLICAMSMLRSMTCAPEESEKWYDALKEYIRRMDRRDGDYRRVSGLRAYLDLALPHRGTGGLIKKIPEVCRLLTAKRLVLPELYVTGGQPSLLRGWKDFSDWVPRDRQLYDVLRVPAETVAGRQGAGLGDIALTESLLEKGEDVSGRFLTLTALQEELRARGALELEFVVTALLVRALLSAGGTGKARELLLRFRGGAAERGAVRLLPNLDAMRCRLSLLDESAFAAVWFAELAPDDGTFCGMERYRYLTKVRCYLKRREHHAALLLLGRILDDSRRCARPLDMLETLILVSICRYRMQSEDWREHFANALELGAKYGYVAVFAREGAALLPLLERCEQKTAPPAYWEKILSGTVVQAGYYGQYLQPLDTPPARLTQTETMILRLISQNKSNGEICSLLHIKLPTAKTHVHNLFIKLKVSSRAEARNAARRLGLV